MVKVQTGTQPVHTLYGQCGSPCPVLFIILFRDMYNMRSNLYNLNTIINPPQIGAHLEAISSIFNVEK